MTHEERLLLGLAGIVVLGVAAQWIAWRLRLPSILLLLAVGFVAGPATGALQPDALLGDLLFPAVSLAVGLILFEGGLSLRLADLRGIGGPVWKLVTLGALVTWLLAAAAARLVLGMDTGVALLLGAIVVVTGPTVIGPLLRHVRPSGRVGAVAQWEGIVIDPIGAVLAVLVYEALAAAPAAGLSAAARGAAVELLATVAVGVAIGGAAAYATVQVLKRYWVPDYLQAPVLLMAVLASFAASNLLQAESGLFTVTLLGVLLANQRSVPVKHIVEFKENLRVVLIASLFVLLAARVGPGDLRALGWRGAAFVALLILVIRPVSVLVSTWGSSLNRRERVFLAWLAPRGIVAASVASVFGLRLGDAGADLMPATFLTIVGTVAVYGLTAPSLARRLGLSDANPQGVLFGGAHAPARALARALQAAGVPVLLMDTNRTHVTAARLAGLPTRFTSLLSEEAVDIVAENSLGRLLAMTSNDEVNALATVHFREVFGRAEVYQLQPERPDKAHAQAAPPHLRGRSLFAPDLHYTALEQRFDSGAVVKTTKLSAEFDYAAFRERYGEDALPLFLLTESSVLHVVAAEKRPEPKPGHTLISLVSRQAAGQARAAEA